MKGGTMLNIKVWYSNGDTVEYHDNWKKVIKAIDEYATIHSCVSEYSEYIQ